MTTDYEPDPLLRAALRSVHEEPVLGDVAAARLRAAIADRAAPVLARRRVRRLRWPLVVPVAVAAALALVFALSSVRDAADDDAVVAAGVLSIDDILDSRLPEPQLRALLAGAAEAEALLLLAAADTDDPEPESQP